MTQEEYRRKFREFVLGPCRPFYEGVKPWQMGEAWHDDSLLYFEQHLPRFWRMVEMLKPVVPGLAGPFCELGSFYPYTLYYFGRPVDLYDLVPRVCLTAMPYDVGGVRLQAFNLCTDELPRDRYAVVVMSEVLEHLPCDLLAVQRKVSAAVRPGGYLLVTYPAQYGNEAHGYDRCMGDSAVLHGGHLREFTAETVAQFFTDLRVVSTEEFTYPAYGRTFAVLYKKDR